MPKSYLIYEKETVFEMPVALCYTVREVAAFLGVSLREAFRIIGGYSSNARFGVFVDVYDPEEEGQMHCDHLPPQNTEHKQCEV